MAVGRIGFDPGILGSPGANKEVTTKIVAPAGTL